MKIVQINETYGTGSIGRIVEGLYETCRKEKHEIYTFCASGLAKEKCWLQIGNRRCCIIHAILSRITGKQGYFSVIPTWRMLKKLDEITPDIVHLHNLHANYVNLRMLFSYLAKKNIATVITLHDCWFYTGKCTYYILAGCEKWKTSCVHCPLLHTDNVNPTFFLDRTHRCFEDKKKWLNAVPRLAVVGVSEWVTGEANKSFLRDRNPVTIYNWIDMNVFRPRNVKWLCRELKLEDKFVILMVAATISEKKGFSILKELSARLDGDCQLIVIGKKPQKLVMPQNVIHIPHTNNAVKLSCYYSMADVCVNTTQYETFGMVTAEALCCGTPVIVNHNTASPELIGPGCGYVVEEKRGCAGVLEALGKIRRNGKAKMTEACVAYARERFDMEKRTGQYLALYEALISSGVQKSVGEEN